MATATLSWVNPTTRVDGAILESTQIASISILDGSAQIGTVPGAGTTFTTGTLAEGVHSFTVTVTDTSGNTSASSNVAALTVPVAAPSPATTLVAVLNPVT